jgi:hypothetical protein
MQIAICRDISHNNKRFLMIWPPETTEEESTTEESSTELPPKINIVLNFFEELKERAPVD